MAWYRNFTRHWTQLKALYDERFYRMWTYYLLACAGSFRARRNQLWQIVFSKDGRRGGICMAAHGRMRVPSRPGPARSMSPRENRGRTGKDGIHAASGDAVGRFYTSPRRSRMRTPTRRTPL